jgi:ketosteroid isomerase-like protein
VKKVLSLLLCLTLSVALIAQTKDEQAVEAAVESLNKAMIDPEKSLLENITSNDLSYGHSGGQIQNKAEFVDDLLHGTYDFISIKALDQKITVTGENAIVRNIFTAKATDSGVPEDLKIGNLMVWRKEHGQWKFFARQAYKL